VVHAFLAKSSAAMRRFEVAGSRDLVG